MESNRDLSSILDKKGKTGLMLAAGNGHHETLLQGCFHFIAKKMYLSHHKANKKQIITLKKEQLFGGPIIMIKWSALTFLSKKNNTFVFDEND